MVSLTDKGHCSLLMEISTRAILNSVKSQERENLPFTLVIRTKELSKKTNSMDMEHISIKTKINMLDNS